MPASTAPHPFAVVTGASSGIGLALATTFAEHGFDLLVTADDDGVSTVAAELGREGTTAHAVQADLTTVEGVQTLVDAVRGAGRPVDALALNAGVGQGGAFLETPLEGDLEVIALDVVAPVRLAKALVPAMVSRGEGRVLFTASTASLMPGPYYATYAASKAFVLSFSEALRHELKDSGVTVTALLPGPTDTAFFERSDMVETRVGQGPKDDPAKVAAEAFDALMKGRDKVEVGSLKVKSQTAAAALLPDRAKAAMHAAFTKPTE
ncbi:SDR family NAD(P)-dependent oxidoreductase [Cellulomonas fengjieae]|uniref:SDR family NAD(P)-dependent oxidoreductase n=1 Tax=Cellulomonas fengjieae TaxID=2819978 RepID=A0ABS3SLC9_9CELL|nr:SDR family NAD(P)-dependent oxidoreductase [Cellulomonas fengjieae]MBO3085776.1 SDR family NAD(P)-dependent oxidoreductase [Cellulomonas fengjieae]QVI67519.1 SDR family NAD(P)-dependent oxidoreductase [Cellulomonas fengjieae]